MANLWFKKSTNSILLSTAGLPRYGTSSSNCCCPTIPVTDCCGNPIGNSLWCDVDNGCVGTTPVEFVYQGIILFRTWIGVFTCPDSSTVSVRLRCNQNATSPSTAAWDLRFPTGNTIGSGSAETRSMSISCSPFELDWQIDKGTPGNPFALCACPAGAIRFIWTL